MKIVSNTEMNVISQKSKDNPQKISENQQKVFETESDDELKGMLYPKEDFYNLPKSCQDLVKEAINDSFKQFLVGQSLIEEKNNFPSNIYLGKKYIELSNQGKCIDSMIYFVQMLIQGEINNEELERASTILSEIEPSQDKRVYCLTGLISLKKNKYLESVKHFLEGTKAGDLDSIYEYGKMLFIGECVKKSIKESVSYIKMTEDQGYKKGEYFLRAYNDLQKIKKFNSLPTETLLFFINNNIDNLMNNNKQINQDEHRENVFQQITQIINFHR